MTINSCIRLLFSIDNPMSESFFDIVDGLSMYETSHGFPYWKIEDKTIDMEKMTWEEG